jgi:hypothetical protein
VTKATAAVLVAGLAVIGLLAAAVAIGKVRAISTSATLSNPATGVYKGVVRSKKKRCRAGRRVTILHDRNGNGSDRSDFTIGSDRTGGSGAFEVRGNQAPAGDPILAVVGTKELGDEAFCKQFIKSGRASG